MNSAAAHTDLVAKLEEQVQRSPGFYKLKLGLLGLLGYALLALSILAAVSFSVGLLVVVALTNTWLLAFNLLPFFFVPLVFALVIVRALLVKFPVPAGIRLKPDEAPELVAEVERLRLEAGAPRLSGIIINDDFNAAAASIPRLLGLFGHRHYLVLGLPLMQLLCRRELAVTIAHEFGHFGSGHGRFSGWIYRVRKTWFRVLKGLHQRGTRLSRVYIRFFAWYAPYFNAYSFALARANEYEADAVSAKLVGKDVAARALVRLSLGEMRIRRNFWPEIRKLKSYQSEPPRDYFSRMRVTLTKAELDEPSVLEQILEEAPNLDDTHPVLRERLSALDVDAKWPKAVDESAAEALLGEMSAQLEARFSEQWADQAEASWRDAYGLFQRGRERIAELDHRNREKELSAAEAAEYATLVNYLRPEVDAEPLLEAAIKQRPRDADLHFRLGALRLDRRDERGKKSLRLAMSLDARLTVPALDELAEYYRAVGDPTSLSKVSKESNEFCAVYAVNEIDRKSIRKSDRILPHELDESRCRRVRHALDHLGEVSRLWLVRKKLKDDQGIPHFIALVHWKASVPEQDLDLEKIRDALEIPGTFMVIDRSFDDRVLDKIRKIADVPVYRHAQGAAG